MTGCRTEPRRAAALLPFSPLLLTVSLLHQKFQARLLSLDYPQRFENVLQQKVSQRSRISLANLFKAVEVVEVHSKHVRSFCECIDGVSVSHEGYIAVVEAFGIGGKI